MFPRVFLVNELRKQLVRRKPGILYFSKEDKNEDEKSPLSGGPRYFKNLIENAQDDDIERRQGFKSENRQDLAEKSKSFAQRFLSRQMEFRKIQQEKTLNKSLEKQRISEEKLVFEGGEQEKRGPLFEPKRRVEEDYKYRRPVIKQESNKKESKLGFDSSKPKEFRFKKADFHKNKQIESKKRELIKKKKKKLNLSSLMRTRAKNWSHSKRET